jgi:hypothetical protein
MTRPPAHAWDWFSRQRLLWRTAQGRLAAASAAPRVAARYGQVVDKPDVLPLLLDDYQHDAVVRDVVHDVIAELVFLGKTDGPFADLGARNAPRGMRWWWTAITGEQVDAPIKAPAPARQLELSEILTGYGD